VSPKKAYASACFGAGIQIDIKTTSLLTPDDNLYWHVDIMAIRRAHQLIATPTHKPCVSLKSAHDVTSLILPFSSLFWVRGYIYISLIRRRMRACHCMLRSAPPRDSEGKQDILVDRPRALRYAMSTTVCPRAAISPLPILLLKVPFTNVIRPRVTTTGRSIRLNRKSSNNSS